MAIQNATNSSPKVTDLSKQNNIVEAREEQLAPQVSPPVEKVVKKETYFAESRQALGAYREQKQKELDSGQVRPFYGTGPGRALGEQLQKKLDANPSGPVNKDMKPQGELTGDKASGSVQVKTPVKPELEFKRGSLIPTPIDRSKLGLVDKGVLSVLNLDTIPPGGSISIKGGLSADGAVAFGGYAGGQVEMSISRNEKDPNKYTIGLTGAGKAGGLVNIDSTAGTAGFDAAAKLGAGGSLKVEMNTDLSKPGEAKDLAGFIAHTMVGPQGNALLGPLEALPGVDLPGEPGPYIRDHISAVELTGDVTLTGKLAGSIFVGAKGKLAGYIKGGVRVEFRPDGSKVLSAKGLVGGKFTASAKAGDAVFGTVKVGGAQLELGAQSQITFDKNWNAQKTSHDLTISGNVVSSGAGVGFKGTVGLESLVKQYPEAGQKIQDALRDGDYRKVRRILQDDILAKKGIRIKGKVNGFVELEGALGGKLKELGVGGELALTGGIKNTVPIASGDMVMTTQGITTKGNVDTGLIRIEGSHSFTYDQLLEAWKDVDYATHLQD